VHIFIFPCSSHHRLQRPAPFSRPSFPRRCPGSLPPLFEWRFFSAQPYLVSVPPPLDISLPSPPLLLFNARAQSCFFPARQSPSSLARSFCRAASAPHTCSPWRWPPRYYQPSSPGRALCSPWTPSSFFSSIAQHQLPSPMPTRSALCCSQSVLAAGALTSDSHGALRPELSACRAVPSSLARASSSASTAPCVAPSSVVARAPPSLADVPLCWSEL
jgi:hypothetical protein